MMYGCAPAPELRIPNAAIKNAKVSVARIRVHSWRSVRPFKEIICGDVSEFESYMPSQAVVADKPFCQNGNCRTSARTSYRLDNRHCACGAKDTEE